MEKLFTYTSDFLIIKFLHLDAVNAAISSKDIVQNLEGSADYIWASSYSSVPNIKNI